MHNNHSHYKVVRRMYNGKHSKYNHKHSNGLPKTDKQAIGRAYSMVKEAYNRARPEWKFIDVAPSTFASLVTYDGLLYEMDPTMASGFTASTRIGDQIYIHSLVIRYFLYSPLPVGGGYSGTVRYIVIRFRRDAVDRAPNPNDVLQNVGGASCVISSYNVSESALFTVLLDKIYSLTYETPYLCEKLKFRFNPPIKFQFSGGSSNTTLNWGLAVYAFSTYSGGDGESTPYLVNYSRLWYTDA